jgi:hypothetical protein
MLLRLSSNFNNSTFIIGFNPSPFVPKAIQLLNKYEEIEILYDVVEDHLVCNSDASGFQSALKTLKNSKRSYDLYWFLHSKAVTTGRHEEREYMLNDFINNKTDIQNLFFENNFVGSYGDMLIHLGTLKKGHKYSTPTNSGNYMDNFYNFKIKSPLEYFYAKTFYVIRGEIINNFINMCDLSFFNDNLNINGTLYGKITDRYFFERDFIRIVDKMGFLVLGRVISNYISDNRWGFLTTKESNDIYLEEVSMWIDINNLNLEKEKILNTIKKWQRT